MELSDKITYVIKLIIFDWDDVFTTGAGEGYFNCYGTTLEELGVKLTAQEQKKRILKRWGQPHREELRELLKENLDLLDRACDVYVKHRAGTTFYQNLKLVDGVNELLVRLNKKYLLTVATGSDIAAVKKQIQMFKIPSVFSTIISSHDINDASQTKPHPFMAQEILKRHGCQPEEAVLVGDAANDVLMARAAGVRPIVVLTGHLSTSEAQQFGVKDIITDVTQIEGVIEDGA